MSIGPHTDPLSSNLPQCLSPTPAFLPQSKVQLKSAVDVCLKLSPKGECSKGSHGPIGEWDVSRVTDMSRMFSYATSFNGGISKWDVSSVKDMGSMFLAARVFNRDLSKWDVSSVSTMPAMFRWAAAFNGDISKWDVSRVTNMDYMFWDATLFKRVLCGTSWVHSRARKAIIFAGSSGSISEAACKAAAVFSPKSKEELKSAVDAWQGDSPDSLHGPIGDWDVSRVTDMSGMFSETAFDGDISKWDVSSVVDMSRMFSYATFNGDLSKWDVSSVEDMSSMFLGAQLFNGDISKWDVSSVSAMSGMFRWAPSFNGDISKWDVSRVTKMDCMFFGAKVFNIDLSKWDVSNVKNMDSMFKSAVSFKQELSGAAWVHSKANKKHMFADSSGSIVVMFKPSLTTSEAAYATAPTFSPHSKEELKSAIDTLIQMSPRGDIPDGPDGPIWDWDVSRVTDMSDIFAETSFDGDISKWDVSRVTDMSNMFSSSSFNGDLSEWDVSSVTDMRCMFSYATGITSDLAKWDVSSVKDMSSMFLGAPLFNGDISKWDVSSVSAMPGMFRWAPSFNGDISKWDVSRVIEMDCMFFGAKVFNNDLSKWDVSNVKNMDSMFKSAVSFKQELSGAAWIHSKANKAAMFVDSSGSISKVSMFKPSLAISKTAHTTAPTFSPQSKEELKSAVEELIKLSPKGDSPDSPHGPIGDWDVSRVSDMGGMFSETSFNTDISKWNVWRVTDMSDMFSASAFNGDISKWDVESVTDMSRMFCYATGFNGDISKWDVSRVTDMSRMFYYAKEFNGDLSKWDVSNVQDMYLMFNNAALFNCDISKWDVSNVDDMDVMFENAISFNQELCGAAWVHSKASKDDMFELSPGSISETVCMPPHTPATTQVTNQYVSRRPITERELKALMSITTPASTLVITSRIAHKMKCPKCGKFKKSGRVSCCAPGGAWYNNCGGVSSSRDVDHRWFEGVEACKSKLNVNAVYKHLSYFIFSHSYSRGIFSSFL